MNVSLSAIFTQLKNNWKSALSVALVSVPLSLSLGIAAGASPVVGIVTAVWAGLIAGLIGGSQFNIVGPAGALSGILAADALLYGSGILPIIAIVAGVLILVVWLLKWDKYLIFVPSSVVHGFTLGVAFTIGFGQLNFILGLSGLPTHAHLFENIFESLRHSNLLQWTSFLPFVVGLYIMFALLKLKPRWPNTIILAVLGIAFGYAASTGLLPFTVPTLFTKYGNLSLHLFAMPHLNSQLYSLSVIKLSAVVAFVALLETLISAKVADGMTKTKFRQRREVLGVGLANIVAGLFGGIPASGVFARTSINVRSGATSSWSQAINAAFVAVIALLFLPYFKYIPLSIIGAILIFASIRMVTAEHFKKLYTHDKVAFLNAIGIALITVVFDATTGILVGMFVALLVFARRISIAQSNITIDKDGVQTTVSLEDEEISGNAIIYRFAGELTYINAKAHIEKLQHVTSDKALVLNFRNLFYVDTDGMEALDEIIEDLEHRKQEVYLAGVNNNLQYFFKQHDWYNRLLMQGKVMENTNEALHQIRTV